MSLAITPYTRLLFFEGQPIPNGLFAKWIKSEKSTLPRDSHPPPIDIRHDSTGDMEIRKLLYRGHSAEQLCWRIQRYAGRRGINLTSSQAAVTTRFQEAHDNAMNLPGDLSDHDSILLEYFNVFNSAFFLGALCFCKLRFEWQENYIQGSCTSGAHADRNFIPYNFACLIRIRPRTGEIPDRELLLKAYIEVLLHEMLHAWFSLYACKCYLCIDQSRAYIGRTSSHGEGWQLAALAIEQATEPLLGIRLKIGRGESMVAEHGRNYRVILGNEKLVELGHGESCDCGFCAR
ncbi:hypothetical protein WAI453_011188 [Rhynchosporium graminicola]